MFFNCGNLRLIRNFSYLNWRLIEHITDGDMTVSSLITSDSRKLQEILCFIQPDGNSMATLLLKNQNIEGFLDLVHHVKSSSIDQKKQVIFHLVPDLTGATALHICHKTFTLAAEKLLEILGQSPLNSHIDLIKDILPELIRANPFSVCRYFD